MKNTLGIYTFIALLGAFSLVGCTAKSTTDITVEVPADIHTQEQIETTPEETTKKEPIKKQEVKPEQTTPEKTEPSTEGSEATEDSTKEIDDIINSLLGE